MPGLDSLSPGEGFENNSNDGYSIVQGSISLPSPGTIDEYYILHQPIEFTGVAPGILSFKLLYSTIDMMLNNGMGDLYELNLPILNDTILLGKLSACRHANGRDWWIIIGEYGHGNFYRLLLDPSGLRVMGSQLIGVPVLDGLGQACFSPDGSKYVIYSSISDEVGDNLNVYDFDRCSGLLSNPQQFTFPQTGNAAGCAISPNSRYLYLSHVGGVKQCDLQADNVLSTCENVAVWDGFLDTLNPNFAIPTAFEWMQLAPDNKIYICTGNTHYLHTIDDPNEPQMSCNVNQHSIQLSSFNLYTMSNFPNFRLGPIDGSPCDTLGIDNPVAVAEIPVSDKPSVRVYPNPVSDYFFVHFAEPVYDAELMLYDAAGKVVFSKSLSAVVSTVDVRNLPGGMYLYSIRDKEDGVIKTGKMVKQ